MFTTSADMVHTPQADNVVVEEAGGARRVSREHMNAVGGGGAAGARSSMESMTSMGNNSAVSHVWGEGVCVW